MTKASISAVAFNVITKYQPTPLAFGNPQHTNLVQITKA